LKKQVRKIFCLEKNNFLGSLLQTIISIVQDMFGFIIVITLIIIGFSIIFLEFDRENEYGVHLYGAYNVLYGNFDDSEYGVSQKLLVAAILFLLNVILLNMLISIMGDTYGKSIEKRILTDSMTRLEMITEATTFLNVFKNRSKQKEEVGYFIYCIPAQEDKTESPEEEAEASLIEISNAIKEQGQKLETIKDKMESKMIEIMNDKHENYEKNIKILFDQNSSLKKQVDEMQKLMIDNHNDMLEQLKSTLQLINK